MNEARHYEVLGCAGLCRTFKEGPIEVEVLKNVNLSINPGQRLAIIGPSGSGKTTLMHHLAGLDEPTSGVVRIAGQEIGPLSSTRRGQLRNRHLGFVYQFHHLLPEFTAVENVAMPLLIRRMGNREAMKAARDMLGEVGLEKRLEHKPAELSGGERQRVAIARALVSEPGALLADEPTGNLDRSNAERVFSLLESLNKRFGVALVVVTHDEQLARRLGTVREMRDGVLYRAGHVFDE